MRPVITARPTKPEQPVSAGLHPLGLDDDRDALLHIPASSDAIGPVALVVSLYGAGGSAQHGIRLLRSLGEKHGFALLSPPSRAGTQDPLLGGFGPDVKFIDSALREAFRRCAVDPRRIPIEWFLR